MNARASLANGLDPMIAYALAAGLLGCGGGTRSSPPAARPETVDELRALPYLGFSSEKAEKGGVVHHERGRASPGFSLYTTRNLCRADLIDLEGKSVKTWSRPECSYWSHAELLPNGDVVVTGVARARGAAETRRFLLRLDWDGNVVWKSSIRVHHDVELTPRGQLATLTAAWGRIPEYDRQTDVHENHLALLSPDGKVIETASFYPLLTSNPAEFALQRVRPARSEEDTEKTLGIDLFHANALEFMSRRYLEGRHPIYAADNVLITVRHQDTVAIVDWPRKKLIWAWGQGELSGPHAGTVLENGNILIFDNGLSRGWSRVVELEPVAKKIVWEYKAPNPKDLFTIGRGAAQRLPNGNTLISNSDHGQVLEVTRAGEVVWEFFTTLGNKAGHRATITRMARYEPAFIESLMASRSRRESSLSARSEQP